MWSAIKLGVKSFFGQPEAIGSALDTVKAAVKGVGEFIDEQNYTEQEKAEYFKDLGKVYGHFLSNTVNESTERSKTRRALSIMVIKNWIGMVWLLIIVGAFNPEYARFIFSVAFHTALITLVLGIGAFFWGTHLLRTTKLSKE